MEILNSQADEIFSKSQPIDAIEFGLTVWFTPTVSNETRTLILKEFDQSIARFLKQSSCAANVAQNQGKLEDDQNALFNPWKETVGFEFASIDWGGQHRRLHANLSAHGAVSLSKKSWREIHDDLLTMAFDNISVRWDCGEGMAWSFHPIHAGDLHRICGFHPKTQAYRPYETSWWTAWAFLAEKKGDAIPVRMDNFVQTKTVSALLDGKPRFQAFPVGKIVAIDLELKLTDGTYNQVDFLKKWSRLAATKVLASHLESALPEASSKQKPRL